MKGIPEPTPFPCYVSTFMVRGSIHAQAHVNVTWCCRPCHTMSAKSWYVFSYTYWEGTGIYLSLHIFSCGVTPHSMSSLKLYFTVGFWWVHRTKPPTCGYRVGDTGPYWPASIGTFLWKVLTFPIYRGRRGLYFPRDDVIPCTRGHAPKRTLFARAEPVSTGWRSSKSLGRWTHSSLPPFPR